MGDGRRLDGDGRSGGVVLSRARDDQGFLIDAEGSPSREGLLGARGVRLASSGEEIEWPIESEEARLGWLGLPPLDRVGILWCRDVPSRERLSVEDRGVRLLRTSASMGRAFSLGRRWLAEGPITGHFGVAGIRVEGELWDVPRQFHVLRALEWLGATPDREALCYVEDCDGCLADVGTPGRRPRPSRICRLPVSEGMTVSGLPPVVGWSGPGRSVPR